MRLRNDFYKMNGDSGFDGNERPLKGRKTEERAKLIPVEENSTMFSFQTGGKSWPVKRVNESGRFYVYNIQGRFNDYRFAVLKSVSPTVTPDKVGLIMKIEMEAYRQLQEMGFPVASRFESPSTLLDKFRVYESVKTPVQPKLWQKCTDFDQLSIRNKNLLNWVRNTLTQFAQERQITIKGFAPDYVRLDEKRNPKLVKFSALEQEIGFEKRLLGCVQRWSQGNAPIFNFLIENFPKELKKVMEEMSTQINDLKLAIL